ncbi:MAG: ABC transporter permease subunit [Pirellulaceae bacterium]
MTHLLLYKCWRESRWLLAGCAASIFTFCWLRVWIVSRLSTDRFRAILEMLPGDWRKFLSVDFEWLITYPGRIALAYQELIVVLCVAVWAIARGSDAVSGEINRGTMEMLLAQPVSRRHVLWTQNTVAVVGMAVLAAAAWTGTAAGIWTTHVKEEVYPRLALPFPFPGLGDSLPLPFGTPETRQIPMRDKVDARVFLPASANLFAMGVLMAGVTTWLSSWDRYRWRTIGIMTGTMIVQVILKAAAMGLEGWEWLSYTTVLSAYVPEVHVRIADATPEQLWALMQTDEQGGWTGLGPVVQDLLLLGGGVVGFIAAVYRFSRRDLPAPL